MTINSLTNQIISIGNGSVNQYSFGFKIYSETEIMVLILAPNARRYVILDLATHYTVTLMDNSGVVNLTDGPFDWIINTNLKNDYKIAIIRKIPLTQLTDIKNQGAFYPSIHELQFDKNSVANIQQSDLIARSLRVDPFETQMLPDLPKLNSGKHQIPVLTLRSDGSYDTELTNVGDATAPVEDLEATFERVFESVNEAKMAAGEAEIAAREVEDALRAARDMMEGITYTDNYLYDSTILELELIKEVTMGSTTLGNYTFDKFQDIGKVLIDNTISAVFLARFFRVVFDISLDATDGVTPSIEIETHDGYLYDRITSVDITRTISGVDQTITVTGFVKTREIDAATGLITYKIKHDSPNAGLTTGEFIPDFDFDNNGDFTDGYYPGSVVVKINAKETIAADDPNDPPIDVSFLLSRELLTLQEIVRGITDLVGTGWEIPGITRVQAAALVDDELTLRGLIPTAADVGNIPVAAETTPGSGIYGFSLNTPDSILPAWITSIGDLTTRQANAGEYLTTDATTGNVVSLPLPSAAGISQATADARVLAGLVNVGIFPTPAPTAGQIPTINTAQNAFEYIDRSAILPAWITSIGDLTTRQANAGEYLTTDATTGNVVSLPLPSAAGISQAAADARIQAALVGVGIFPTPAPMAGEVPVINATRNAFEYVNRSTLLPSWFSSIAAPQSGEVGYVIKATGVGAAGWQPDTGGGGGGPAYTPPTWFSGIPIPTPADRGKALSLNSANPPVGEWTDRFAPMQAFFVRGGDFSSAMAVTSGVNTLFTATGSRITINRNCIILINATLQGQGRIDVRRNGNANTNIVAINSTPAGSTEPASAPFSAEATAGQTFDITSSLASTNWTLTVSAVGSFGQALPSWLSSLDPLTRNENDIPIVNSVGNLALITPANLWNLIGPAWIRSVTPTPADQGKTLGIGAGGALVFRDSEMLLDVIYNESEMETTLDRDRISTASGGWASWFWSEEQELGAVENPGIYRVNNANIRINLSGGAASTITFGVDEDLYNDVSAIRITQIDSVGGEHVVTYLDSAGGLGKRISGTGDYRVSVGSPTTARILPVNTPRNFTTLQAYPQTVRYRFEFFSDEALANPINVFKYVALPSTIGGGGGGMTGTGLPAITPNTDFYKIISSETGTGAWTDTLPLKSRSSAPARVSGVAFLNNISGDLVMTDSTGPQWPLLLRNRPQFSDNGKVLGRVAGEWAMVDTTNQTTVNQWIQNLLAARGYIPSADDIRNNRIPYANTTGGQPGVEFRNAPMGGGTPTPAVATPARPEKYGLVSGPAGVVEGKPDLMSVNLTANTLTVRAPTGTPLKALMNGVEEDITGTFTIALVNSTLYFSNTAARITINDSAVSSTNTFAPEAGYAVGGKEGKINTNAIPAQLRGMAGSRITMARTDSGRNVYHTLSIIDRTTIGDSTGQHFYTSSRGIPSAITGDNSSFASGVTFSLVHTITVFFEKQSSGTFRLVTYDFPIIYSSSTPSTTTFSTIWYNTRTDEWYEFRSRAWRLRSNQNIVPIGELCGNATTTTSRVGSLGQHEFDYLVGTPANTNTLDIKQEGTTRFTTKGGVVNVAGKTIRVGALEWTFGNTLTDFGTAISRPTRLWLALTQSGVPRFINIRPRYDRVHGWVHPFLPIKILGQAEINSSNNGFRIPVSNDAGMIGNFHPTERYSPEGSRALIFHAYVRDRNRISQINVPTDKSPILAITAGSSAGITNVTYKRGFFTEAPIVTPSADRAAFLANADNITTTATRLLAYNHAGTALNSNTQLVISYQGDDYLQAVLDNTLKGSVIPADPMAGGGGAADLSGVQNDINSLRNELNDVEEIVHRVAPAEIIAVNGHPLQFNNFFQFLGTTRAAFNAAPNSQIYTITVEFRFPDVSLITQIIPRINAYNADPTLANVRLSAGVPLILTPPTTPGDPSTGQNLTPGVSVQSLSFNGTKTALGNLLDNAINRMTGEGHLEIQFQSRTGGSGAFDIPHSRANVFFGSEVGLPIEMNRWARKNVDITTGGPYTSVSQINTAIAALFFQNLDPNRRYEYDADIRLKRQGGNANSGQVEFELTPVVDGSAHDVRVEVDTPADTHHDEGLFRPTNTGRVAFVCKSLIGSPQLEEIHIELLMRELNNYELNETTAWS